MLVTFDAPTVDPRALRERRMLVVVGGGSVSTRELPTRGRLAIGRAVECEVRIDDPTISRAHATLVVDDSVLSLLVESRTGRTRVDGHDVTPGSTLVLTPGQLVEIGNSRLVVRRENEPAGGAKSGARPMDATRRSIELAGKSDLPVLVLGETGAGKEVAMDRIVALSSRSRAPLVRIDCAALPEALLERELHGVEKSGVRGSRGNDGGGGKGGGGGKAGLFEAASGGTVFLDEIANVPLALQSKLLGILESRAVMRLGATTTRPIDVRVIAATNSDVRARVAQGSFREDLYFRLAGIVVTVPPLRDRQHEIPELARTLLVAEAERAGVRTPSISEGALALLVSYRWPGNVRELRNALGRALHLADNGVLEPEHLSLEPPSPTPAAAAVVAAPPSAASSASPAGARTDAPPAPGTPAFERARIVAAMERAQGNQKEAARLLGMTRRMLMYRLDTYDLPRPRKR